MKSNFKSTKHKKGYFRKNAELNSVFVNLDGIKYQVDTSELDLNSIIEDISFADNLEECLHPVSNKGEIK